MSSRGRSRLRHVERALASLTRAESGTFHREEIATLRSELETLHDRGVHEEGQAGRRRLLLRVGAVGLVLLVAGILFVARQANGNRGGGEAVRRNAEEGCVPEVPQRADVEARVGDPSPRGPASTEGGPPGLAPLPAPAAEVDESPSSLR